MTVDRKLAINVLLFIWLVGMIVALLTMIAVHVSTFTTVATALAASALLHVTGIC